MGTGGPPSRLHPLGAVVPGLPGVTEEQQQRVRGQAERVPAVGFLAGEERARRCMGVVRGTAWAWRGARAGGSRRKERVQAGSGRQGPLGSAEGGPPRSPDLSPQSSQPSTTSPFKQEVFVYSPSPSSESPSLGPATTPIIMSRSPTGGCAPRGVHPAARAGAVP